MFSLYFLIKRNLSKFEDISRNKNLKPHSYSFEIEGQTFAKRYFHIFKHQTSTFRLNYSENYILFNKYRIYFENDILKFRDEFLNLSSEFLHLSDKFPENINDWTEEIQFYFKLKHG